MHRAVALVLGICALALVLGAGSQAVAVPQSAATSQGIVRGLMKGKSLNEALEAAGFVVLDAQCVPAWFTQEVIDASFVGECYATSGLEAVFVSIPCAAEEGLASLRTVFEDKGWVVATDDGKGTLSLMKERGICRWMTVSAEQSGEGWDAVLRIQRSSSERSSQQEGGDGS